MALILLLQLVAIIAPAIAEIQMSFTKWPESVTAPVGDTVTFECVVTVPGERLAWRWRPDDGTPWTEAQEFYESDGVSTRIAIEIGEKTKPGFYQCVVWYGAVVLASVPARLRVARISPNYASYAQKRVIVAPVKNTVALHCRPPASDPPALISWQKADKGKRKQIDTPHGVLVLQNVTTDDSGAYSCTATNELSGQVVELPDKVYLKVQHESQNDVRFLETEDYVGTVDNNGVLTTAVRPGEALHLWCGIVGNPQPAVSWSRDNGQLPGRAKYDGYQLTIASFRPQDEGIYSCKAGVLRRSWRVLSLQPAHWTGEARGVNGSEGSSARISCGAPVGQPRPKVFWLMNAHPVEGDPLINTTDSELYIEHVQKRHASIVQCFACNDLGCAYDAALLTVVPVQISDQDYKVAEAGRAPHPPQPPKRHYRKNPRKHTNKPVLVPPSRPNVTRMADDSVMVSWSNGTDGLPILFFKVQYKEATNYSNSQWNTCTQDIQPYVHTHQITGLVPDRYYKFRISAVYSNQDNKQGRSTGRFHLQRGDFKGPNKPVLLNATALSPTNILLNWTWSPANGPPADGFYVYYRAISSAGEYVKVSAPGAGATSLVLSHLVQDVGYDIKVQAYHTQAPSEFSAILKAKTLRAVSSSPETTTEAPRGGGAGAGAETGGGALLTAGGAAAVALVCLLAGAFLLCRRAKRPHRDKEKVSVPEGGGANGYMPAKVPITITANPMHAEGGENGVEMSYMHNNNTGNDDNTLSHTRKNGPANRQYV